eukprot:m.340543 g.340543  ORF g.340543 m.340543 type:complete len:143 (+) comp19363_c0_seq1:71-499(+)
MNYFLTVFALLIATASTNPEETPWEADWIGVVGACDPRACCCPKNYFFTKEYKEDLKVFVFGEVEGKCGNVGQPYWSKNGTLKTLSDTQFEIDPEKPPGMTYTVHYMYGETRKDDRLRVYAKGSPCTWFVVKTNSKSNSTIV